MIMCIIGTRPEAIKMAPVVKALQAAKLPHALISTGQHMDMVDEVLKYFKIKLNGNLRLMKRNQTPGEFLGRAIEKLYTLLAKKKPTAVLAQGDTTTVAAVAQVCFNMSIPFGHVEAGLRTHDLGKPWPEEWNRRIASLCAQWHFAPTEQAQDNLYDEKVSGQIFLTGNTIVDALQYILKVKPVQLSLPYMPVDREYILLTCHRRENIGQPMLDIFTTMAEYAKAHPELDVVYPVHPNPMVSEIAHAVFDDIKNIRLINPLPYAEFIQLLANCRLIVSDSGGVQEEAPSLGKRVVVLREVTERPEGVESGHCCLAGTDKERIKSTIDKLMAEQGLPQIMSPYGDGRAASRIVKIVQADLGIGETL